MEKRIYFRYEIWVTCCRFSFVFEAAQLSWVGDLSHIKHRWNYAEIYRCKLIINNSSRCKLIINNSSIALLLLLFVCSGLSWAIQGFGLLITQARGSKKHFFFAHDPSGSVFANKTQVICWNLPQQLKDPVFLFLLGKPIWFASFARVKRSGLC